MSSPRQQAAPSTPSRPRAAATAPRGWCRRS
jgi:hypothetical protein